MTGRVPKNIRLKETRHTRYSGAQSAAFWKRVNRIKSQPQRALVFQMACYLQDFEWMVLKMVAKYSRKK